MFDWITRFIDATGYLGIALLMLVENLFPPIPSELIMPLAGYVASRGDLEVVPVVVAGSVGSLAGAWIWYGLARRIGLDRVRRLAARHGRWLTLAPDDVDRVDAWFDRHGRWAVLVGRLVPTVRTLVSVPAGLSGMSPARFAIYSGIGTAIWTTGLTVAGFTLGQRHDLVQAWLNPIATAVVAVIGSIYVFRVLTWRSRSDPSR